MRVGLGVVGAVAVVLLASCSGGRDADEGSDVPSADEAISSFDDAQGRLAESLAAVALSAEDDPDAMREAALGALDATEPAKRFAAVYGLTLTASTASPPSLDALRKIAGSSDETERLLAAGSLAALGETDGVDILIDALTSEAVLRNVDPPMTAWRYARANLLLLVGQDLGLVKASDAEAAATAQRAWRRWWEDNAGTLTWNAQLGRFEGAA